MTAGTDDDRLLRADVDRGSALVGVAVLPEAFQTRARIGVEPWCVAGLDSQNPAGELLLADDLIHMAVEDEFDALFPGAELQASRQAEATVYPPWRANRRCRNPGSYTHWIEARVPLLFGVSSILRRQRARLDVGLGGELQHGLGHPRAGHSAAKMGAVDPRKSDVILQLELPGQRSVVGPGTMELAIVVSVPGHAAGVHDRPVGHVLEQQVWVVFQICRRNRGERLVPSHPDRLPRGPWPVLRPRRPAKRSRRCGPSCRRRRNSPPRRARTPRGRAP